MASRLMMDVEPGLLQGEEYLPGRQAWKTRNYKVGMSTSSFWMST